MVCCPYNRGTRAEGVIINKGLGSSLCQAVLLAFLCPCTLQAASTLSFPRVSFEADTLTGIAIVNPLSEDALVTLTAYGDDGQPLADINNPVQVTIPAQQQFSRLTSELFGVGLDPDTVAWFQATSPVDGLTGFFLFLDIPLPSSFFDGADLPVPATSIVFTQVSVESGNATELNIVNPGTAIANLKLELMRPGSLPISKSLSLPVHGVVRLDVATFFGVSEAPAGTYVGVSSNVEIAGFELVSAPDGDLVGLNARSTNEQLTHLYFPQLAVLGPFETTLGVVNNSNQAVILTVTAFKPEGSLYDTANPQRNPVTRSLNPGESLVEDVESMFGFSGGETLDGWLQVESTSESVTGFITYGTPLTGASATVTPARVGQTRAIFSHIATVTDFFTGVAVLNAGQLAANVRVLAITPAGQILGSFDSVLQPGQRISKLIHELIPEAIGQSGGLIWVKSDLPVHLTSLFGSTAVLANIPPQAAPEAYEPDAGLQTVRVSPSLAIVQPQNTQSFTVNASGQNIVWKVNGVAGGDPAAGIISATGSYTAPSEVPSPQVVTVSAEVDNNTAGASVDVLEKTELFASQRIIQSVAYLGSLERIYTAELAILSPTSTSYPLLALAPSQLVGDSEIFEVPNPGAAKQLLTTLVGEIISKMISYTATTGKEFLLLAGQTTGRVIRLDPTTLETVDVAVGLNSPSSLVIDPNSGDLLVAEQDEVTSIPRADVEASLAISPSALEARVSDFPQAITQIQASGADGVTVDRCTGNVYTSDTQLGVIRELNALTGELQVLVSGLQAPGQLLALYRANVGCPDSVELLVVEAGADQVTLTVPREGLVAPWIPATDSTDLSFLPEGTPFAFGSSVLLPEFVGGEQPQQGGDRYSLRSIGLQQHRRQPSNPESKPPETKPTTPEPITPEDDTLIPQNDATIDCPPDSASGFGFQIRFSWTPSSSPAGEVRYRLRVKNKGAPRPLLDTTVEDPEFTLRACNEVVTTENLEDWEWQVLAVDTLDNFSDPSGIGSFEFEECLLDDTVPCLSGSDLSVTKSGSPNPTVPEGPLTYTLEVRNRGPASSSDVVLNDQLPFRVSFQSVTSSQGSCLESNGSVACRLGTLTAGASATVKIFVLVRASAAGATIVNSALVLAAQDDPDYSNNRVEVETKVLKGTELQADLSLTKSDSPDRVEPGQQLIYSLSIQNNGPSPATGVRLSDKLPSGLTFSSVASSQGECEESKGSVSCELEEMPPGSSAEVRIAVRVTTSDESVTNVASVKANEDDPDGDNNTAKEETEIVGISPLGTNLALIKSDNKDPAEPGSTLIYSLTVDNEGPDDAVDVILTDELPPLVTFLAAEASQGLCSESKGMVTCKLGVLPRGEAVKTEIAVNIGAAAAGTVLINTAAVGADQEDLNNDDNVARETTTVLRGTVFGSDVYVEKQDSKDPVEAEERFAYLLTVGNAGPGPASGVTLTDELPPELIFIAGKSSQGECNESSGTVRCELGSLARGESAEVVVSVQVDPSSPATRVLNHASVGATETDPNQSNNEAEEETSLLGPLAPEADVSLSKRASPNPVQAGSSLSYKLTVRNAGPDPASQVKLVDSLPAEVSFVVVESSQVDVRTRQERWDVIWGTCPRARALAWPSVSR